MKGNSRSLLAPVLSVALLASAPLFAAPAAAQEGFIDYLTPSGTVPLSAYVLIEPALGSVQVYPARISEIADSNHALVSTEIPTSIGRSDFGVAFVTDPLRESPPVKRWSADAFTFNMLSQEALTRDVLDLDAEIKKERIRFVDFQDQVQELQQKLSETLEIREYRETLEEKREVERSISEQQREIARLEVLLEEGRQLDPPENVNRMRLALASHLRQAAQVSAAADRLTNRKLEVARNRLKAKLKRIEALKQEDPALLARQVLEFRAKRRELENRLGKTSARSATDDQF